MDTTTILLFTFVFFAPMAIITIFYLLTDRTGGYLEDPVAMGQLMPGPPPAGQDARIDAVAPTTAAANDDQARVAA